ncbi:MAG: protein kinase [Polyangiaceae bacterium]
MATFTSVREGARFGGDYTIESRLREGGMGAVYVAHQTSTDKKRALKLMLPSLVEDPKLRERFEREARVGARIESDHVVEVVGAGVDAETGIPWLAMELLQGEELGARLAREGRVPPVAAAAILRQVGHGLAAAHRASVIHRDVKPENIFLAQARRAGGPDFVVKILDFGIARIAAESKTSSTETIGSPFWMAPEQATPGAAITPATDVWAFGLLAFALLGGRSYWMSSHDPDPSTMKVLREVLFDPMPPASERAAAIGAAPLPPGFDAWFATATDREPSARFPDAQAALDALDPLLAPPEAAPPRASDVPAPTGERASLDPTRALTIAGAPVGPVHVVASPAPTAKRGWIVPALLAAGFIVAASVGSVLMLHEPAKSSRRAMRDDDDPPRARAAEEVPTIASSDPEPSGDALLRPSFANLIAPADFGVAFHTTAGDFAMHCRREWAPAGADRIYNLVKLGYFTDVGFFRVVVTPKPFVAQFGLHGDPRVNAAWKDATLPVDPVKTSNTRGRVTFAMGSSPTTRTTQLFVDLGDNTSLDRLGFAPVCEVVGAGMDVVDRLYAGYREEPSKRQQEIATTGNAFLRREFPRLDYVLSAELLDALPTPTSSAVSPPPAASSAPPAAAAVGGAALSGGTVANAGSVVAGMSAGFRACYQRGLAEDPTMAGTVRVTAKIGPSGEVQSTSATSTGNLSGAVVACVQSRVASAQFSPPEGGGATLVIPVTFQPG